MSRRALRKSRRNGRASIAKEMNIIQRRIAELSFKGGCEKEIEDLKARWQALSAERKTLPEVNT